MRNAADSRYPAINCRIADTSAALRRVVAPTAAAGSLRHAAATRRGGGGADDGGGEALSDESFVTRRSVGAETQTNTN